MTDAVSKFETAKNHKDAADQAFKDGKISAALMSYHQALLYLQGLDKSALQSLGMSSTAQPSSDGGVAKEKTEIDDLLEKVYANMSACYLKNGNWKRAIESADKALKKNENNYKVMFRKAKALGEEGFLEKSKKLLEEIKNKNPSDTAVVEAEIARMSIVDNERTKESRKKLKGFLNKAEKKGESLAPEES